jgi:hypothetical protein
MDEILAAERLQLRVRAQTFLGTLTGAFSSTWERPEELHQALLELLASHKGGTNARTLLSYIEVLRSPLMQMCEAEAAEGEAPFHQPEQGLKRQKQGENGGSNHAGKGTKVGWIPQQ